MPCHRSYANPEHRLLDAFVAGQRGPGTFRSRKPGRREGKEARPHAASVRHERVRSFSHEPPRHWTMNRDGPSPSPARERERDETRRQRGWSAHKHKHKALRPFRRRAAQGPLRPFCTRVPSTFDGPSPDKCPRRRRRGGQTMRMWASGAPRLPTPPRSRPPHAPSHARACSSALTRPSGTRQRSHTLLHMTARRKTVGDAEAESVRAARYVHSIQSYTRTRTCMQWGVCRKSTAPLNKESGPHRLRAASSRCVKEPTSVLNGHIKPEYGPYLFYYYSSSRAGSSSEFFLYRVVLSACRAPCYEACLR
ncbi:hypothetical protein DFH11DRAFT_1762077 [Phellopilus nigrolimitatus]|nr:hypothetical protein DFH11DRAFT_1762077 [Phellopilus nigrolimitatus]